MVRVVDVGTVEVVGGARVQGGRPYFLDLPLPRSKSDPRPTISDLHNICITMNAKN